MVKLCSEICNKEGEQIMADEVFEGPSYCGGIAQYRYKDIKKVETHMDCNGNPTYMVWLKSGALVRLESCQAYAFDINKVNSECRY